MCDSRRPTEGADSSPFIGRPDPDPTAGKPPRRGADAQLRLYRVRILDLEGPAYYITVRAIGRNDAREQARTKAEEQGADRPGVVAIEEVVA